MNTIAADSASLWMPAEEGDHVLHAKITHPDFGSIVSSPVLVHVQAKDSDFDGISDYQEELDGTDANSSNANSKILTEDSVVTSAIQTGVLVGEETHTSERFRQSLPVDNDNDFILEDELGKVKISDERLSRSLKRIQSKEKHMKLEMY